MKTLIAIPMLMLALGQTGHAQLTLNAGDTYTYSFTSLPGPTPYIGSAALDGLVYFTLSPASLQASTMFSFEMFEDTTAGSPIFSRTTTGADFNPFIGDVRGAWRDLQGAVRFSVTAGSVTLDQVQIISFFSGPPTGLNYFSTSFTPVPEPGVPALAGAAALTLCLWSRIRRIKNRCRLLR